MNQKSRKDNTLCVISTPDNFINYMIKRSIWGWVGTIDQCFFAEVSRKYQRNSAAKQILLNFLSFPGEFRYSSRDQYTHYTINSYLSFLLLPVKSYHSSELLKVREGITKTGGSVKSTHFPIVSQHDSLHYQRYSSLLSNRVLCGVSKYNVHNALHANHFSDALDIYNGIKYFLERFISKTYFMLVPEILERLNLHKTININYNKIATILPLFQTQANDYYQNFYHTGRSKESHVGKTTPFESDSILTLPSLYGKSSQEANEKQRYRHYKESTSTRRIGQFIKPGITRSYYNVYTETLNKFTRDVLSRSIHEKDVVRRTERGEGSHVRKATSFESDSILILPSLYEKSSQEANERQRYRHYKESTSLRSVEPFFKPGITRSYYNVYTETLNKFTRDVLSRSAHEKDVVRRTERGEGSHVRKAISFESDSILILPSLYEKPSQEANERQRYRHYKESTGTRGIGPFFKPGISRTCFDVYSERLNRFTGDILSRFTHEKDVVRSTECSEDTYVRKTTPFESDSTLKLPSLYGKSIQKASKRQQYQHYEESTSPRRVESFFKPGMTRTHFDVYSERLNKFAGDVLNRLSHEEDVVRRTELSEDIYVRKTTPFGSDSTLILPSLYGKSIQKAKERQRYQNRKESHVTKAVKATSDLQLKSSNLYNIPTIMRKTLQRTFRNEIESSVDKRSIITINRLKGFYLKKKSIDNKAQKDILDHNFTHIKQIAMPRKGYTAKTMNEGLEYNKLSKEKESVFYSMDSEAYKNRDNPHFMKKMNMVADGYSDLVHAHNPSDMVHYSSGRLLKSSETMPKEEVVESTVDRGLKPSYRENIEKTVQLREYNPQAIAEKVYGIIIEKIKREREMRG